MEEYNLVNSEPVEWACDTTRGYFGYSVHIAGWPEGVGFPAFTHEQMLECKRITESLGKRYSFDEFPHLVYDEGSRTWAEVYYSDMSDTADVLEPFTVDGIELYALGMYTDWAWGKVDDDWAKIASYQYEVV